MRGQAVMQDGAAHATRRLWLAKGPVHGVKQAQGLDSAVAQIAAVALEGHDAADVHVPQIHRRMAVQHPIGQHLARATGRLDADGVKACGHKQIAHLGRFAQQIAVVGGKAFGAVEEQIDAGFFKRRGAVHGSCQQRLDMLQIVGQGFKTKGLGNAFHTPGLGHRLEPTDQELASVFFEIRAAIRVPQHRQIGVQAFHGLGHDVEMFGSVQRHRGAGFGAKLMRPHTGAVDYHVRANGAELGAHAHGFTVLDQYFLRSAIFKNARATAFRAFG